MFVLMMSACVLLNAAGSVFLEESSANAYCGHAAVELAVKKLGCKPLKGDKITRLRSMPRASIADLRAVWETNQFECRNYRMNFGDKLVPYAWQFFEEELRRRGVSAIVLMPDDLQVTNSTSNGHFWVVSDWSNEAVTMIDPATGHRIKLAKGAVNLECIVQLIRSGEFTTVFDPLTMRQFVSLLILPIALPVVVSVWLLRYRVQSILGRFALMCFCLTFSIFAGGCDDRKLEVPPLKSATSGLDTATVYLSTSKIDLGSFKETTATKVPITVVNDSDDTIQVDSLELSCHCLSTDFDAATVPPGGEYSFNVEVAKPSIGPAIRNGAVLLKGGQVDQLNFEIRYEVLPSAYLMPGTALLGMVRQSAETFPMPIDFVLVDLPKQLSLTKPLSIVIPESANNRLTYDLPELNELEPDSVLTLTAQCGEGGNGYFKDEVHLVAESAEETLHFRIELTGTLIPAADAVAHSGLP